MRSPRKASGAAGPAPGLLVAALLLGAMPAIAAVSAAARMSDIRIEVVDLAPGDGIAPSFALVEGTTITHAGFGTGRGENEGIFVGGTEPGFFRTRHAVLDAYGSTGTVSTRPQELSGRLDAGNPGFTASMSAFVFPVDSSTPSHVLSPYSRVEVSAHVIVAQATNEPPPVHASGRIGAGLYLEATGYGSSGDGLAIELWQAEPLVIRESFISVALSNDTAEPLPISFQASLIGWYDVLSPGGPMELPAALPPAIPEPGAAWLLLAGLAAVAGRRSLTSAARPSAGKSRRRCRAR